MIPAPADVASPAADATTTASGLASKVLKPGTGTKHPAARSKVRVHYSGWTTDGKMFDSSVARNEPLVRPAPGDSRVDRGRAVDGRRRNSTPLDPREAGLRGRARRAE